MELTTKVAIWAMTLSSLLSIFAAYIAIQANYISKEANKIAEKANYISNKANKIAEKAEIDSLRPKLEMVSMLHSPLELKAYVGSGAHWQGKYENLDDEKLDIIKSSRSSENWGKVSTQVIDGVPYMLVNVCSGSDDSSWSDVILLLDVATIKFANTSSNTINKLIIKKSYSELVDDSIQSIEGNSKQLISANKDYVVEGFNQTFTIRIAYAFRENSSTSIKKSGIEGIQTQKLSEPINILALGKAKDIFAFSDSAYLIEAECRNGESYYFTFHMFFEDISTDNIFVCQIYEGEEKYDIFFEEAKKMYPN